MGLAYGIESQLPGRIRLSSPQLQHLGLPKAQVENFFLTLEGMKRVRYTPASGTLTLHFDPRRVAAETLFSLFDTDDRAALRRRIAAAEIDAYSENEATESFLLHSAMLATVLLHHTLPFGFYAAGAAWLGWPRLKKGGRSLLRLSWDEQLLEGSALVVAIATHHPLSPLLMLWFESAETLILSRLVEKKRALAVPDDETHIDAISEDYAWADGTVLPAAAIAGISFGISGKADRSAAILSINRHKGVRVPERFAAETGEETDTETSLREIETSARFNLRAADIALLSAATGLLPPVASTLVARSARIFTAYLLAQHNGPYLSIHTEEGVKDDNQRGSYTA